jgi:TonB family protein
MGKKKILVVDFDQEFLRFLSQFLCNKGFSVSTAADGSAGLEKCKAENPDLIITEAMLPKLHGFELCSRITHSATQKIPVIIVTGIYKDTIYKTEALHTFGASAYFEKPLDPDDLLVSIRKVLGLPAEPGKSENDLDEAIMESLASAPMAQGPTGLQLQTESHPTSKKGKKDLGQDEIDNLLQSTLAEFGLKTGKKKTSVEASKPKSDELDPVPAALAPKTPRPSSDANIPWILPAVKAKVPSAPKASPASLSPRSEEKKSVVQIRPKAAAMDVPASTPLPAFGEFLEKKKRPFFPKIFGAVAGIMILMSAMVFFLKPGRSGSPRQEVAPPITDGTSLETAVQPAGGQQAPDPTDAAAKVKKPVKTQPNAEAQKPPVNRSVEARPQAVEDIKPLIPDSDSLLQLQAPDSAGTDAAKEAASDQAAAAGDTLVSQGQNPSQGGSADPLAAPIVKLKAGDLVPLGDVDILPQVLKAAEPAYPSAALSMRVAGSVTVNALVSETGDVLQTAVVRGVNGALGFNKAAETAVRKWKFSPAEKGGVKVRVWKPITITFKLKS